MLTSEIKTIFDESETNNYGKALAKIDILQEAAATTAADPDARGLSILADKYIGASNNLEVAFFKDFDSAIQEEITDIIDNLTENDAPAQDIIWFLAVSSG